MKALGHPDLLKRLCNAAQASSNFVGVKNAYVAAENAVPTNGSPADVRLQSTAGTRLAGRLAAADTMPWCAP